ncbi:MAG TPA: VOC family protein [Solirubrobacterales bacterium]|nr:VOC family protein [Solirubrobacterales bacterium]
MFDHVTIRVSDRVTSARFYRTVLQAIEIGGELEGETFTGWHDFSIAQASEETPVTRNLHVGFVAPSRHHVDEFWRAGTEAGFESDGAPGPRPQYTDSYYGSFLLDPDGNSIEAVHHDDVRDGNVDHLWIGVSDPDAAAAFYRTIAPQAGLREGKGVAGPIFRGANATFSLIADGRPPTENLHLALSTSSAEAAGDLLDPDGNSVELIHRGAAV